MNGKGQISVFIIAGILIVAGIVLFFLLRNGILPSTTGTNAEENPGDFVGNILEPKIKQGIKIASSQGGEITLKLYKTFDGENISYLCYTQNYYEPCRNQQPKLIQHLREEIKDYINKDVEDALDKLRTELERKGYEVSLGYRDFDVVLLPKKIRVDIDARLTYSKAGVTEKKEGFSFVVSSRFYDIASVAQEIVSQEARFCHFEQQGFMLFYPDFEIDKFRTSNLETLYTIKHRQSEEEFKFFVRGCVIPPGF